MTNKYWELSLKFQDYFLKTINLILEEQKHFFTINLNKFNLLSNKNSIIKSSTAIGFLVEEFIISQLINKNIDSDLFQMYRDNHNSKKSYDCYYTKDSDIFLVNIKTNKNNNNAIAAIQTLLSDYKQFSMEGKTVHFAVIKLNYSILTIDNFSKTTSGLSIQPEVDFYFLEQIDFSKEHIQDKRNWSKEYNACAGRLLVSKQFLNEHSKSIDQISNLSTLEELSNICKNSEK